MLSKKVRESDVLLVVDMQYDFMPGGALAVAGGDELLQSVNKLTKQFSNIIFTQDWHPAGHISFASSHVAKKVFESVMVDYGVQELWPEHCLCGTHGAKLHGGLVTDRATLILRKGCKVAVDSYSAFFEKDGSPTGLAGFLKELGKKRVFICGLAMDFCVRSTAEDAVKCGFKTFVISDACRAVDIAGSVAAAINSMNEIGVEYV